MADAAVQPVSAQLVANAFVQQYYQILHHSPGLVYRFYQETSKLGRPDDGGSTSITSLKAINDKIMSLNYEDSHAEIKSVDAQDSHSGGVHVLVIGYLTRKSNTTRKFAQTFFLAPQDKGYFVLNDVFRFIDDDNSNADLVTDVSVPVSEDSVLEEPVPEVHNPTENENDTTVDVEEEIPIDEVVDALEDSAQRVEESDSKLGDAPKKSYASIVMHLKQTGATFSPPPARKFTQKKVEPERTTTPAASTDEHVATLESIENENHQDGEADGYSIYVRGLPMSATDSLLEEVFKKFGRIKNDGIQVRSNRGFCFGFVEFEEAISVQKALEASPVSVGGRQAFVEEKRSTNNRGSSKSSRFPAGRSFGFRSDGVRSRGNYSGRSYNNRDRSDFNGRNEPANRGGSNRGAPSSRDGYQRSDNNRNSSGMSNGNSKNTTPRISATA